MDIQHSTAGVRLIIDDQIRIEKLGGISKSSATRHVFSDPEFPKDVGLIPGKNLRPEHLVDAYLHKLIARHGGKAA